MESLQLGSPLLLRYPRTPAQAYANSRLMKIAQLGFPSFLKRAAKNANLRAFPVDNEGGVAASQDDPFAFEDEEVKALPLSTEMDDFGSIVGFHLGSENGAFLFQFFFG